MTVEERFYIEKARRDAWLADRTRFQCESQVPGTRAYDIAKLCREGKAVHA